MGVFKGMLLEERVRNAEALADQYAGQADIFADRLAAALTRLRAYEPDYVAAELGEAAPTLPVTEPQTVDGEIIPPNKH